MHSNQGSVLQGKRELETPPGFFSPGRPCLRHHMQCNLTRMGVTTPPFHFLASFPSRVWIGELLHSLLHSQAFSEQPRGQRPGERRESSRMEGEASIRRRTPPPDQGRAKENSFGACGQDQFFPPLIPSAVDVEDCSRNRD